MTPSDLAKEMDKKARRPAHQAVELVRELFAKAYDADALTDVWKLVTALRGPDFHVDRFEVGEEPGCDVGNRMRIKDAYTVAVRSAVLKGEARDKINLNQAHVVPDREYSEKEREEVLDALEKSTRFNRAHYQGHGEEALKVIERAKKFEAEPLRDSDEQ